MFHLRVTTSISRTLGLSPVWWQRPQHGRVKCNVDAAFSDQLNRTGTWICIHDKEDCGRSFKVVPCFTMVKWHALWQCGLHFRFKAYHICLPSSLSWHYKIWSGNLKLYETFLTSHFTNSRVEFNRRQSNEILHNLVGVATLSASSVIYFNVYHCIEQLIINEMIQRFFF
jgi:hypothetical protein